MMNKQRCGKQASASKGKEGPSKKGNGTSEYGDKANMEYKQVTGKPVAAEKVEWSK